MDKNIIFYVITVCFLLFFGRVLISPLKKILIVLIKSTIGALLLFIVNYIGNFFWGFSIGINIWTSLVTGLLGVPGVVLLILIKIFI